MRFNREQQVWQAVAGKDDSRANLREPYLWAGPDAKRGDLVATDGHFLVRIPVELDPGDERGFVPCAALKEAAKRKRGDAQVCVNGTVEVPGGPTFPRPSEEEIGKFPDWEQVVPRWMHDQPKATFDPKSGRLSFALNATYLARLAKALGDDNVILTVELPKPGKCMEEPIQVKPADANHDPLELGVLMPYRINR